MDYILKMMILSLISGILMGFGFGLFAGSHNVFGSTKVGHTECVLWNLGCHYIDNIVNCKQGKFVKTDTWTSFIMVGKVLVPQIHTDDYYEYSCVKQFDNGTVLKYKEVRS